MTNLLLFQFAVACLGCVLFWFFSDNDQSWKANSFILVLLFVVSCVASQFPLSAPAPVAPAPAPVVSAPTASAPVSEIDITQHISGA